MTDNTPRFDHSSPSILRRTIFSLLFVPQLVLANRLTIVEGPGGTPKLLNQSGVPIINIVAPNAGGLSHNRFLDFNVGQQGLVLNNGLEAGQSQLHGQAGRINIISTAEGAGVCIGAVHVTGCDGVKISTAGDGKVELGGSTVTATTLSGSDYGVNVGLNFSTSPVERAQSESAQ